MKSNLYNLSHSYFYNIIHFNTLLIILNLIIVNNQISDNFSNQILEAGSFDLLDIKDYHNLKLVVTTSKKIYIGIPPTHKSETEAKFIKFFCLINLIYTNLG